ncbi:MAG TPA: ABC transporter ATP-binding protein [Elusimicrobiota bacterium]|nr:ABC transporter ATP-binding protein [Elusimicrobiota bacterium]
MNAVELNGLSKIYRLYPSPKHRLWELLSMNRKVLHNDFYAVNDISLAVKKGETVGIVGQNGSGKSTLLEMIAGVLRPSKGAVHVNGRVSALLELGAGFNAEFTGRENVYMNGALAGFNKKEMDVRLPEIESFAEIGEFIDQPVKTYSSGMFVRLAFSSAINMEPDILVIDEALAVGDVYFQHKCFSKLREFKEKGATLLFVSHDAVAVKGLCDRVVLLENGRLLKDGAPDETLDFYNGLITQKEQDKILQELDDSGRLRTRSGNFRAKIETVEIFGETGTLSKVFHVGENVEIRCRVRFHDEIVSPTIGIALRDRVGNEIFGTNSYHLSPYSGVVKKDETLTARFRLPVNLGIGNYSLSVAVHSQDAHTVENYDWLDRATVLQIVPGTNSFFVGSTYLPASLAWGKKDFNGKTKT